MAFSNRSKFSGELADRLPIGHEHLEPDRYTGTIRVRLTTETPLLVCDDEKIVEEEDGHKTYAMRIGADGRPLIMPSSVRGMLRSSYEAITNSRFGVFPGNAVRDGRPAEQHGRRSGFRLPARQALDTVPVRIVCEHGRLIARHKLLRGSSRLQPHLKKCPCREIRVCRLVRILTTVGRVNSLIDVEIRHRQRSLGVLDPMALSQNKASGANIDFDFWNVEEPQPATPRSECSARYDVLPRNIRAFDTGYLGSGGWNRGLSLRY